MKNIFLIAISLVYNLKMYIQKDFLIDFYLSFVQFYLLIFYLIYTKLKKFLNDKIIK